MGMGIEIWVRNLCIVIASGKNLFWNENYMAGVRWYVHIYSVFLFVFGYGRIKVIICLAPNRKTEKENEALSIIYFKNCRPCISISTDNEWTAWVHCEREGVLCLFCHFFFFGFIIWLLNQCFIRGVLFRFTEQMLKAWLICRVENQIGLIWREKWEDCNCCVCVIFKTWLSLINYCLVVWNQNTDSHLIVST